MCHGKAQNVPLHGTKRLLDLCATGRHNMCHGKAQYVPQYGTKRLMCHGKAQNVPQLRSRLKIDLQFLENFICFSHFYPIIKIFSFLTKL
jgi:hypothetical protein